jgi:hypothetical protein
MSDTLGPLMERNLLEVFGQRDSVRRAVVIAEIYAADCTFHEADERIVGRDALNAKIGDILKDAAGVRVSPRRASASDPRPRPFAVELRTCRNSSGCHRYGPRDLCAGKSLGAIHIYRQTCERLKLTD